MMAGAPLPPSLEPLRIYLDRANELKSAKPLVAHHVRMYAMQIGMALRPRMKATDVPYLVTLMDELEAERQQLCADDAAEGQRALRAFALDLYSRATAADKPEVEHPHPSQKWTVVEAPRVAKAFHASAVLLDAMRQFSADLPPDLLQAQTAAHRRSQQLSQQLSRALSCPPCVPAEWRPLPAAMLAPPDAPPAPAPGAPVVAAASRACPSMPSAPTGALGKRGVAPAASGDASTQ